MRFKLISLNLWYGGSLWDEISDFLRKERPDILACQEAQLSEDGSLPPNFRSVSEIKKLLPHLAYSSFAPAYHGKTPTGPEAVSGNAVLSRFEIKSSIYTFVSNSSYERYDPMERTDHENAPRNLQHVRLEINDEDYNLFNLQGIWGTDNNDSPARLKMAELIAKSVSGQKKCFLCGDFNIDMHSQTMEKIEGAGMTNLFKDKISTSFNMKRKPTEGQFSSSVVDSVLVSPDVKILSATCPEVDISDHLPQVVVFEA